MAFFGQRRVGELTSRLSADLSQIQDTLTGAVPHFLRQVVLLVGGVALIAADLRPADAGDARLGARC